MSNFDFQSMRRNVLVNAQFGDFRAAFAALAIVTTPSGHVDTVAKLGATFAKRTPMYVDVSKPGATPNHPPETGGMTATTSPGDKR